MESLKLRKRILLNLVIASTGHIELFKYKILRFEDKSRFVVMFRMILHALIPHIDPQTKTKTYWTKMWMAIG